MTRGFARLWRSLAVALGAALPSAVSAQDDMAAGIRPLIAEARLPGTRQPEFSRYAPEVARLYAARGGALAWRNGASPTRAAREAIALLRRAAEHGLDPRDYDAGTLDSAAQRLVPAEPGWLDVALTVAVMRYVDDLRFGRVHPRPLSRSIPTPPLDLAKAVGDAIVGDSIPRLAAAVAPPFTQYRRLQQALAAYRQRALESGNDSLLRHHIRQIELALERLRWLPPIGHDRFVVVNVPAFELFAFDSVGGTGAPTLRMKVIVGKALNTRTPVLVEQMRSVELRPAWNVPRSILVKEILPRLRREPGYLRSQEMELVTPDGRAAGDMATDTTLAQLERGELRVRQRPSPRNALGRVKFVFPNAADVYLHDTPNTELFARTRRDFSHGCIRIEHPVTLANWVLRNQPEWMSDRIAQAIAETTTTRVPLRRPIPVIVFYTTAVVEPDGRVVFYNDIYGHDRRLDLALTAASPP